MVNIEAVKNKKKNETHICTTYSTSQQNFELLLIRLEEISATTFTVFYDFFFF